ncbi:MAG: SdpI family protein [Clostridia bacterium]|nr:SdpI family protein [Clostridia bacterium]
MLFWIFMLIFVLLIPSLMIIFGTVFKNSAPKEINYIYGYRTPMSTSSKEAWEFAHKYMGRLWLIFGIIILIPSVTAMLFVIGLDKDTVGYTGMAITFAQIVLMIIPIIPTEIALRKNFDKNGNKK